MTIFFFKNIHSILKFVNALFLFPFISHPFKFINCTKYFLCFTSARCPATAHFFIYSNFIVKIGFQRANIANITLNKNMLQS